MEEKMITNEKTDKKYFSSLGFRYFFGTLIIFAVQLTAMGIVGAIGTQNPSIAENFTYTFLAMMLSMYLIAAPIMMWLITRITPQGTNSEKKKMKFGQMLQAFCISIAILYAGNIVGNIITAIIGVIKQNNVDNVLASITTNIHPLANLFIIAICAPIVEEFIFRKILIDRTRKYGEFFCAMFSASMFALYHGNLNQFVYAFALGIFFAFIYIKTNDIRYPIILHIAVNFIGSFVSTTLLEYSGYAELAELTTAGASTEEILTFTTKHLPGLSLFCLYALVLVVSFVAGIILFFLHRKKMTLAKEAAGGVQVPSFKTAYLNWGMGLFSIFWIIQIITQLLS